MLWHHYKMVVYIHMVLYVYGVLIQTDISTEVICFCDRLMSIIAKTEPTPQWVLCKLVCSLYQFAIYTAWGNWWLEKKNHEPDHPNHDPYQ